MLTIVKVHSKYSLKTGEKKLELNITPKLAKTGKKGWNRKNGTDRIKRMLYIKKNPKSKIMDSQGP